MPRRGASSTGRFNGCGRPASSGVPEHRPRLEVAPGPATGWGQIRLNSGLVGARANGKEGLDDCRRGQVLGTGTGVPGVGEGASRKG